MKNVFKLSLLTLLISSFSLVSCSQGGSSMSEQSEYSSSITSESSQPFVPEPDDGRYVEVTKLKTLDNGRTIIEYLGKPFLGTGIQIRTDAYMNTDHLEMSEMEIFFQKASELGVSTVEVPVEWKDVEVGDNEWDFTYMKELLDFVNKYNLKLELLWFGSNMCGDTHSYSTPEYILKDGKTYQKCDARRTGEFWDYYGVNWHMDHGGDNLIERESYAIKKVLKYVYEYNEDNNNVYKGRYPLVAFQVLNEADIFARFRIKTKYVRNPATNELYTWEDAFNSLLKAYDAYGKAVKTSKYRVYTRVNVASSLKADEWGHETGIYEGGQAKSNVKDAPSWVKEIYNLEGIDCVGDDPYFVKASEIKGVASMFATELSNNYSHIAENYGRLQNTPQLVLAAFSQGAGYNIYDLASSPYFIKHGSSETDQGICVYSDEIVTNAETGEKTRVQELRNHDHFAPTASIFRGLKLSSDNVLEFNVNKGDFAVFNCFDTLKTNVDQVINIDHAALHFTSSNGALAFAVSNGEYLDIYSTKDGHIELIDITVNGKETLEFEEDDLTIKTTTVSDKDNSFDVKGGVLYRVRCTKNGTYGSNAWNYIG